MIKRKQLFKHDPENGIWGDCFRTAVACLLNVEPEVVPHAHAEIGFREEPVHAWLEERGLLIAAHAIDGKRYSKEEVLAHLHERYPGVNIMLSGSSVPGTNHVVIVRDGEVVWDPNGYGVGLVGPCDDDNWHIEFIAVRT